MSGFRVGLTGGLASGKSTVAAWLGEAGFQVVDGDRLVNELYLPGGAGAEAVARLFGRGMLDPSGAVDASRLAARVFQDDGERLRLERAIHPLVRERFAELAERAPGVVVLEATRLVEAGYAPDFDLVVTVEAPAEERRRRAVARGLPEEEAWARLRAQGEGAERRAAAHVQLDNDGDLGALRHQVNRLIATIRRHAAETRPRAER